ncbi:MAG: hypothetical protein CSA15_08265 [Candidatus Delongbacteria bacterium]|nr:MAG: hypothetical protein CSA15_08265 [Candidatus Delongbacteria bacterium]
MKILTTCLILLIAVLSYANGRKVVVTGTGDPDTSRKPSQQRFGALRAAEADAVREMLEELKGMYIDSKTVVKELILSSDKVKTQVEGVAKFYEMVGEPSYMDDGSVELTIQTSLDRMDWRNKVVKAVGIGSGKRKSLAKRAAKIDAKRKLAERINGLYLASASILDYGEVVSDEIKIEAESVLKNAHMVKGSERYFDDGTVEVTYEVKLDNNFEPIPGFTSIFLKDREFDTSLPRGINTDYNTTTPKSGNGIYTGLIIDCRGIDLRPALAPKIVDKAGNELYGTIKVSREFAVNQGMMGYLKTIDKAKENIRVGKNPLVIKAESSSGANKTDIVVDENTASQIRFAKDNFNFLRECRVIAVVR